MIAKKVWYCWTGRPSRWGSTQVSLVHCWALRDWERSSPCTSERLPGTLAEAIAAVPRYRPSDEIPRRVPHRHRDLPAMRPAGCASSPASSNRRSLNGSLGTSAVRPAPSIRDTRWTWCAEYGQRSHERLSRGLHPQPTCQPICARELNR
jgi:hypothetical protein